MAWMIHTDHIADDKNESSVNHFEEYARIPLQAAALGMRSPALPPDQFSEKLELVEFRLYDDDGELYYEGRLHDDDECLNQSAALAWGEGMAGCTTIKVQRVVARDGGKFNEWVQEIG